MSATGERAEPRTLQPRLEHAAGLGHGITFIGDGRAERVEWARLHDDARAVAAALQARDVGPGTHVTLLGRTTRELVTALQAVWLTGATVVVLPLPLRLGSLEGFVEQTGNLIRQADAGLLLVDPALASFVEPRPGDPPTVALDLAHGRTPDAYEPPHLDPSSLAILQFTSGSTADPKGVMMPHAGVCANLDDLAHAAGLTADDVVVSWLPMYHDMGLIGLLGTPMTLGAEVVLASPQEFLARPGSWAGWLSEYRGTVTGGPNFGYALAARAMARLSGLDLSSVRVEANGAEPIDLDAMERYNAAGAPFGLSPGAMLPGYGLAEATLAVTFPPQGRGIAVDVVDARALEQEGAAVPVAPDAREARRLPRLGHPLAHMAVRVVNPGTGDDLSDRMVGEIEIAGPSVTPGYYRRPDATAAAMHDGWLRTGDLGYLAGGELVVTGRIKDLIIVGGRNVYPQDVEREVAAVDGVRAGNVVAFGVADARGHERIVVLAESRSTDPRALRRAVADRVQAVVGLPPGDVVLLEPGALPKTSSGKLQRSLSRSLYLDSAFRPPG